MGKDGQEEKTSYRTKENQKYYENETENKGQERGKQKKLTDKWREIDGRGRKTERRHAS